MRAIIFLCFLLICFLVCFLPQWVLAAADCTYECNCYDCNCHDCNCHACVPGPTCCDKCCDQCCETCYTPCPDKTRECTAKTNCKCENPGTKANKYMCDTDEDKTCTSSCDGATCNVCTPTLCSKSDQGTDADIGGGDGYYPESQCQGGDCDDTNPRLYPNNTNKYCNCLMDTPAEVAKNSRTGVPEWYGCKLKPDDPNHWQEGCLCIDDWDNDCDGLIDDADPDCPRPGKDWIIDRITYTMKKNVNALGVYVINSGTLTIPKGITLGVDKKRGLHVEPGSTVNPRGTIVFN